jgi:D-alanyl-D-alanine carboxypeptidase
MYRSPGSDARPSDDAHRPAAHRRFMNSSRMTFAAAALMATLTLGSACSSTDTTSAPTSTATTAATSSSIVAPTPSTVPAALQRTLTGILEAHHANHDFVGATLAVRTADGATVTLTSGTQDLSADSRVVDPTIPWGIGSITKTFIAVVVLQLADEGVIDLDASIGSHFPDLPSIAALTPRQLLQHTSGLHEYLDEPAVQQDAHRPWSSAELVGVAEAAGRVGEPGAGFHYANTNFIILGELVERVTGKSWEDEVRERILEPLDMQSTALIAPGGAHGFGVENGTFVDYTNHLDVSLGSSAGGLQSTSADLLTYVEALGSGQLLSSRRQAEMQSFIPADDLSQFGIVYEYGLGLERYSNDQVDVVGHLGGGAAHSAFIGFDRKTGNTVVAMINSANSGPQGIMGIEALMAAASS